MSIKVPTVPGHAVLEPAGCPVVSVQRRTQLDCGEQQEYGVDTIRTFAFLVALTPRLEYVLTDKGKSLGPILKAMREWGAKHT